MRQIQLSSGIMAMVDDEDYHSLSKVKWYAAHTKKDNPACIYARNIKREYMHRIIMGAKDPKIQIDHKDGNRLNNQRSNLRLCTNAQNAWNTPKKRSINGIPTSQYKGVWYNGHSFRVSITINNKRKHLGHYANEEDAARAYNEAAKMRDAQFVQLNDV
jgi:hypothetical protein